MDRYIRYLIISFVLMFVMMLVTVFNSHVSVGFLGWLAFLVSGTLLTGTGAFIGRLFLDFVRPDIYLTTGAVDAFYKRLFWSIGPQFIGGLIGFMATQGFMSNVLGYAQFSG
ncbi:hypothetical protein MRN14_06160 [bacterium 19NY03SH02]|uniref:Uncharacterized protein n=2 Tax=Unclassified Bacteria TaxID=49928 RepID=A0AAU6VT67_UNCXX